MQKINLKRVMPGGGLPMARSPSSSRASTSGKPPGGRTRSHQVIIILFIFLFLGSACTKRPPGALPQTEHFHHTGQFIEGIASWYGKKFHGRKTASGEKYNMHDFTAAHKKLPFGTLLEVTHLENNKKVIVKINDRGPYVKKRILDLSKAAAEAIDIIRKGCARVKAEIVLVQQSRGDSM